MGSSVRTRWWAAGAGRHLALCPPCRSLQSFVPRRKEDQRNTAFLPGVWGLGAVPTGFKPSSPSQSPGYFPGWGVMLPPAGRGRPGAGAEARACGAAPARVRRRGALFRRRFASARLPGGDAAAERQAEAAPVETRGRSLCPARLRRRDAQESWCDEQGQWQAPWQGEGGRRAGEAGPAGGEAQPRPGAPAAFCRPRLRPDGRVPVAPAPPGVGGSVRAARPRPPCASSAHLPPRCPGSWTRRWAAASVPGAGLRCGRRRFLSPSTHAPSLAARTRLSARAAGGARLSKRWPLLPALRWLVPNSRRGRLALGWADRRASCET